MPKLIVNIFSKTLFGVNEHKILPRVFLNLLLPGIPNHVGINIDTVQSVGQSALFYMGVSIDTAQSVGQFPLFCMEISIDTAQ